MNTNRLEYYRSRYAALTAGWESATAQYQHWVAAALYDGARVLDLGCGRGGIVERLYKEGRWYGVDPDYSSLAEHRRTHLPRVQGQAAQLPFANASFAIVVSSWVLEHLPKPQAVLTEVARILRPGGWFFFLTPNAHHPIPLLSQALRRFQHQLVAWVYGRSAADTFPVWYKANTPEQLTLLAVRAGLRPVHIELVADPSYLAWNELSFRLAIAIEYRFPPLWKVHLVGAFQAPESSSEFEGRHDVTS